MESVRISTALLSVSDKTGIGAFARFLHNNGVKIVSTSGTAKGLSASGIPVTDVSSWTGFPEILGGRVKTLHPKVTGAILARPGNQEDDRELADNGIGRIGLVVVNLYPFESAAGSGKGLSDAVESIDIGGPTLLRSAAKNFEYAAAVCDPADYGPLSAELEKNGMALSEETRKMLALKAFRHTARYDAIISSYLGSAFEPEDIFPQSLTLAFSKAQDLRYGENPHQKAALYSAFASGGKNPLLQRKKLWGKELSYNNLLDIEAAVDLALEFHGNTAAVIIKHNNPCGVAIRTTGEDAFVTALSTDSKSAFGGVICFTQPVDSPEAKKVSELFTEVVIAPSFSSGALALLEAKRNVRIIEEPLLSQGMPHGELEMRGIRGGLLVQQKNDLLYSKERKTVAKRAPTDAELAGLDFAWRVCKHVKSNAVVYAKDNRTVGVGAGQMSRVDCVKIASMKAKDAGLDTTGCVMASDAFFPFRDAVDEAAKAGITAIIQPGGSIRDAEVIAAADAHGIAMVFTGIRQTWH